MTKVLGFLAVLAIIAVWTISSNVADPEKAANAYRVQLQAQAEATQQAQTLQQQALDNAQVARERAAVSEKMIEAKGALIDSAVTVIKVLFFCLAIATGLFLLYTAQAYKKFADIRVSMIRADAYGRLPALVRVNQGHYQILDGATGLVLSTCALDLRNPADVQQLRQLMMMYSANVTTKNAAQARLPQTNITASYPALSIIEAENDR